MCHLTVASAVSRALGNAGYSWPAVCQWGSGPSHLPCFGQPALGGHDGRRPGLGNVGHIISAARNKRAGRVAAVVGVVPGALRGLGRGEGGWGEGEGMSF